MFSTHARRHFLGLWVAVLAASCSDAEAGDPRVTAACRNACDEFEGSDCWASCRASCGSCTQADFDYGDVVAISCPGSGQLVNFSTRDGVTRACTIEDDVGSDDGTGTQKRVFVTSKAFSGDLASETGDATGLEAGDTLCDQAAQASDLGGVWKAWLSSVSIDAIDHVADVGPFYNVTRTARIFDAGDLAVAPIDETWALQLEDEKGMKVASAYVWTGTLTGGKRADTCRGWTSRDTLDEGQTGIDGHSNEDWTQFLGVLCHEYNHLYCFEQE